MNDEAKTSGPNWLNWAAATVFAMTPMPVYLWAHYATSASVHRPGYCCNVRTHEIGGQEVPDWVENYFFWPAYLIENTVPGAQWREERR